MWLTKEDVLKGKYYYPKTEIKLIATNHVLIRMKERGLDPSQIPAQVKVTSENIHSAKTYDGITIKSVVIKSKFDDDRYLFLVINPFDGGLKSMWFRPKRRVEYESRWKTTNRDNR